MFPNQPGVCIGEKCHSRCYTISSFTVAIGPVTRHLFSVAIDPAIGHMRTCHSRGTKVTVLARISTTTQLTVKCSSDLATVGRTMMEVSVT